MATTLGGRVGVACVGGAVVDVFLRPVSALPPPGDIRRIEEVTIAVGGCGANSASALVRLGVPAAFVGRLGADELGEMVERTLAERGVEVWGVSRDPALRTTTSVVFVDPAGEKSILTALGASLVFAAEHLDWERIAGHRLFFLSQFGYLGAFEAEAPAVLARARALGMPTALDMASDASRPLAELLAPCLPLLDYFIPSYEDARLVTGLTEPAAMAERFHAAGVPVVAIKLGAAGAWVSVAGTGGAGGARGPAKGGADAEARRVPAYRVEARDATGAGDAWCGGFLAAILEGADPFEAARLGNAVGACCVTETGAYAGIRTLHETRAWMAGAPLAD